MLHHVSLPVSDLQASRTLYDAALSELGYQCVFHLETAAGYGIEPGKDKLCLKLTAGASAAGRGFHLAFTAPSVAAVDRFHGAALAAGATDNGPPGLRPQYGPDYYAAFIIDPDGHRLEAVFKPA
jgi:catechol 2,3-dioxygenase-like lactoylglutathione lyase family enzyme